MSIGLALGEANRRLVAPLIPACILTVVCLSLGAAWGLLALTPTALLTWGGPGPGVAALHLLGIGVLLATVALVVPQILPVITLQDAPPAPVLATILGLLVAGLGLLAAGFAGYDSQIAQWGTRLLATALVGFLGLWLRLLWRGRRSGLADVLLANVLALGFLGLAAAMGALLGADYGEGLLADHQAFAHAHGIIAAFGFMGQVGLGFSGVLVPMLAIADPPARAATRPALLLGALAVLLAAGGLVFAVPALVWAGLAAGGITCLAHLRLMAQIMGRRLRPRLDPAFWLIRLSWVLLPAALVAGAGALAGIVSPLVMGVLLLPGWLLTLLLGVLQRIVPFLTSMHTVNSCARPIAITKLSWPTALPVLALLHVLALALLLIGVGVEAALPIRLAGLVGLADSVVLGAFFATIAVRALAHRRAVGPKPPPSPPHQG
ncbi:hypothetical protein CKO38_07500 [Rhodospirillum rubrum]|uniref:hypothetical protein n=1 Tax=Rhodospirillum rubrum TaxID=1085 RepID=UPI001907379D|nr:hypothetical protein [Rhodospirillum rubrum]MBK1665330.1 hypothetical protein [Rhodospirillum rubrum]MBK1676518.1 hypothetical protein [Rhodospirillum rubrum]